MPFFIIDHNKDSFKSYSSSTLMFKDYPELKSLISKIRYKTSFKKEPFSHEGLDIYFCKVLTKKDFKNE